jgi:hypothetical protein
MVRHPARVSFRNYGFALHGVWLSIDAGITNFFATNLFAVFSHD